MSPVLQGLLNVQKKDKYRFHMPGHKGKTLELYEPLINNLLELDFTEINGTDDLYNPTGILKEGLKLLTEDRESKRSLYLTNGTTVGILASIMALTNKGDEILMAKDCHKSVYNAIELKELKSIIIENEIKRSGLVIPISEDIFLNSLKKNSNIKMVVLTRPNYYGLCENIDELAKCCNENNIYLLIDEAHGSHFKYHEDLPLSAMKLGAHISVNSFHKTMISFTQTSVLNLNDNLSDHDISSVLTMVEKLQTSSPSYLFISSIDISRNYMENSGKGKLNTLRDNINSFYNSISSLNWIKIPDISSKITKDFTRIILETSIPAVNVQEYLEEKNIYIEMISKNILVLICTTEDEREDFEYLSKILNEMDTKKISNLKNIDEKNFISLDNAEGKILNENIIIYPPGSIYLKKGDIILKENIEYIKELLSNGINVYTDFNKDIYNLYVSID